jgi:hypothetical protein
MTDAEHRPRRVRAGDLLLQAYRIKNTAACHPGDPLNPIDNRRADELIERVTAEPPEKMTEIGAGGELAPFRDGEAWLRNTVTQPDYVTIDASHDRLELANQAGVLEMGLDAAVTIGAQNSLEKMLAHQLAALHRSAMNMTAQMNNNLHPTSRMDDCEDQARNVEVCRMAGAISRMQSTFQRGLLALQRLRSGGKQVVTVQHVQVTQVADGGKAIVAAEIPHRRRNSGRGRRRKGATRNER